MIQDYEIVEFGENIDFYQLVIGMKHIRPLCNVFLFSVMIQGLVDGGGELLGF